MSPEQLREVVTFTREAIASAVDQPAERFFSISALERLTNEAATREWAPFESYLRELSGTARERLVSHAGARAVKRLARRVAQEVVQRQDALRRPLAELEARVAGLRRALVDLDRSLIELRFRFDAAEANLGSRFELQRMQFIGDASRLHEHLHAWIDVHTASSHVRRKDAFEEASRLATSAVEQWFDNVEPEASRLYRETTDRFVEAANDCIRRVAAESADLDVDELPPEVGFRLRRQFYFTHLMHTTAGTPVTWLIDRLASQRVRKTHVERAAAAYLTHLLDTNSHRVENDFKDRARESRRWLEAQNPYPSGRRASIGRARGQGRPRQATHVRGGGERHVAAPRGAAGRSAGAQSVESSGERDGTFMKRLGIIGGIGPESTVVYYRALVAAGRERLRGAAPPILINSIDVRKVLRLAEDDPVPGLRDYLLSEIAVLARGGVSIGLIGCEHAAQCLR